MIYDYLIQPFTEFSFMRRALVACLALSFSGAPLGVILIHRRLSLIGDTMSHAVLPGAAIGYLIAGFSLVTMSIGGIIAGLIVALLSGIITRATSQSEDTSLASFYLISLALGVLLISLHGSNVDLIHILFGSILAVNDAGLYAIAGISTATLLTLAFIYRGLVAECLDPVFTRAVGARGAVYHVAFLIMVVINLIGNFMALGTLMSVGLMILPAAASRFLTTQAPQMMAYSILLALASSAIGLLLSYHYSLPSGPAIILSAGTFYVLALVFGPVGGILSNLPKNHHLTR